MSFHNVKIVASGVDAVSYHAQSVDRGHPQYKISPSVLRDMGGCYSRWKDGYEHPASAAMNNGNLIDTLALSPGLFSKRYVVLPLDAPRRPSERQRNAKKPSAESEYAMTWWDDFLAKNKGAEIISAEEKEEAEKAVTRLRADTFIASFLDNSDTQVLVEGEWRDGSGIVVPVRCLIDVLPRPGTEFADCAGDLKTCRSAALGAFRRQVFDKGYDIQAAFDLELLAAAGDNRHKWVWLLQENYPPFQTGRRQADRYENPQDAPPQNFLTLGRARYARILSDYCLCLKTGIWPDYDQTDESSQGVTTVDCEPWMAHSFMFGPRVDFPGEGTEDTEADTNDPDLIP